MNTCRNYRSIFTQRHLALLSFSPIFLREGHTERGQGSIPQRRSILIDWRPRFYVFNSLQALLSTVLQPLSSRIPSCSCLLQPARLSAVLQPPYVGLPSYMSCSLHVMLSIILKPPQSVDLASCYVFQSACNVSIILKSPQSVDLASCYVFQSACNVSIILKSPQSVDLASCYVFQSAFLLLSAIQPPYVGLPLSCFSICKLCCLPSSSI